MYLFDARHLSGAEALSVIELLDTPNLTGSLCITLSLEVPVKISEAEVEDETEGRRAANLKVFQQMF